MLEKFLQYRREMEEYVSRSLRQEWKWTPEKTKEIQFLTNDRKVAEQTQFAQHPLQTSLQLKVEGRRWCLCLLRYSHYKEQNCFSTHVISIYLASQKFWNRETQIFRSNIWTKNTCTLKFKTLLIFPVCSPHRKYVNVSCLSPACFLIQVQICRKTLNILIQTFTLETFFNKSLPACKIPCPVPLYESTWYRYFQVADL